MSVENELKNLIPPLDRALTFFQKTIGGMTTMILCNRIKK